MRILLRRLVMPLGGALGLYALLWALGWSTPSYAVGQTIRVTLSGSDVVVCGSVATPCRTIKYAVETRAAAGDEVLVAAGTYTETFNMQPDVTVRSASGSAATFIDGENVRGPMVVASGATITETARLEGFTVKRSNNTGMTVNQASPVISDCVFADNTGSNAGGLVVSGADAAVAVYNSAFLSNTSTGNGGGIEVMDMASLRLVDSRLVRNSAKSKGGGVMGDGATRIEVTGSRFTHNHAGNLPAFSGFGGGLGVGNGTGLVVTDSEFFTNSTEGGAGGGIDIYDAPYYTLTAITVMHNEANQGGGLDTFNSSGLLTGSQIISNVAKTGRGGGLLATEGNLTVVSSVFAQNRSDTTLGGGARIGNDMEALFLNTHFVENQATTGSGLCVCGDNITAVMRHCNFRENVGMTEEGAALTINEGKTTVVVMDSRLRENTGGAIWVGNQSRATIANNVVVNNPPHSGIVGQVRLRSSVAMTFTHNTVVGDKTNDGVRLLDNGVNVIANNIVVGQRNGIHFSPPATATLRNNLLWDNTTDYVDTAAGAGDVYSVPGFVDPAGYDYHLGVCSAAVDAAGSTAPVERDYDLDLRPVDGDNDATATADIGADERLTQTGKLPAAAFTYTVDGPDVAFTNASSYASAYQWDFGVAGATSVLTNPTYSYGGIGVYTVTLSATGDFGCVDQVQTAVAVVNVERHLLLPQLTVAPD